MKSEKGNAIVGFLFGISILVVIVLLLIGTPNDTPYIPNWSEKDQAQKDISLIATEAISTGEWKQIDYSLAALPPEDWVYVPEENNHADLRHKEAKEVRDWVLKQKCGNNPVTELKGLGIKDGFHIFLCIMKDGKHIATYIVIDAVLSNIPVPQGKVFVEITCFVNRSWNYISKIIDKGWYFFAE